MDEANPNGSDLPAGELAKTSDNRHDPELDLVPIEVSRNAAVTNADMYFVAGRHPQRHAFIRDNAEARDLLQGA